MREVVEGVSFLPQLPEQAADRPVWLGGELGTDDPDRERQEAALPAQVLTGLRLRRNTVLASDAGEEIFGAAWREDRQVKCLYPQCGAKSGATCNDQAAAGSRWDQGKKLGIGAGVVEDDQDAAVCKQVAVQLDALIESVGDRGTVDTKRLKEASEGLRRRDGLLVVKAVEVDEELSIRVPMANEVGDMDGQCCLADPSPTNQCDRATAPRRSRRKRPGQTVDFGRSPGEVGDVGRQ
jgi:hypothetical protein